VTNFVNFGRHFFTRHHTSDNLYMFEGDPNRVLNLAAN